MATPRNKTTNQLLDEAIKRLISDAQAKAVERKTTIKQISKLAFNDTRTLPLLIKGRRRFSIERVASAAKKLKEI